MKNFSFIFMLGLFALSISGFSQTKVFRFTYDDSGNREQRELITLKSGQVLADSESTRENVETMWEEFEVKIYPNPTKGNIKVGITGLAGEKAGLYVFNLQGKLIANSIFSGTESIVNLSQQPAGMYLMKIRIGDKSKEWKIIKE